MIISLLNQKGGVGKTTLAIHLAIILPLVFPEGLATLLIDADPQGSTRDWNALVRHKRTDVIALDRPSIDQDILSHAKRYDFVIVDGPSGLNNGQRNLISHAMIKCSDIILVPAKPSQMELNALEELFDLINARYEINQKLKSAVLLTQQIRNSINVREMRAALCEAKLKVFDSGTTNRVAYATSIGMGKTVLDTNDQIASDEVFAIANELKEFIK